MQQSFLEKKLGTKIKEVVEIYHDEIYDDDKRPFGHQFLVIPIRSKKIFNNCLQAIRDNFGTQIYTINWKKIGSTKNRNRNLTAREWLGALCEGMYCKSFKWFLQGNKPIIKNALGIKIASIFIDSLSDFSDEYWFHVEKSKERTQKKYGTLLRMGLQGCLHYCFSPDDYSEVLVKNFFTDGSVFGNVSLNNQKIIEKLETRLREYIKLEPGLRIIKINKSKIKTPGVNFEELADTILGATRYLCGHEEFKYKEDIVKSLKDVYQKRLRKSGFKNSPHFRTFTVSKCKIDKNKKLSFTDWDVQGRDFLGKNLSLGI